MKTAKRSIAPNGETVRRLRELKSWSQEKLAEKAGCHKKTIDRAERGVGIYASNLEIIAQALGVVPSALLETIKEAVLPSPPKVEIVLLISIPHEEFQASECQHLLDSIRGLLNGYAGTRIVNTAAGSTVVTLELDIEQARLLVDAFVQGKLQHLKVFAVKSEVLGIHSEERTEELDDEILSGTTVVNLPPRQKEATPQYLRRQFTGSDVAGSLASSDTGGVASAVANTLKWLDFQPAGEDAEISIKELFQSLCEELDSSIADMIAQQINVVLAKLPIKLASPGAYLWQVVVAGVNDLCARYRHAIAHPESNEPCNLVLVVSGGVTEFALEAVSTKEISHRTAEIASLLPIRLIAIKESK